MEIWKNILGHKGYQVSNLGRVRSLDRFVQYEKRNGNSFSRFHKGKILSPLNNTKYGHVLVYLTNRKREYVHRLVLRAFIGKCPKGKETRHLNSKPRDNKLINLKYGTRSENAIDLSKTNKRKLKMENILMIRKFKVNSKNAIKLSDKFNVSKNTIYCIWRKKVWAWL